MLVIGFGRFGQIISQPLLARGFSISIIETEIMNPAANASIASRAPVLHRVRHVTASAPSRFAPAAATA